jgi:hypothetical protein
MSADEGFLARWSRRKRIAATTAPAPPPPEFGGNDPVVEGAPAAEPGGILDPASLPPIDSIDAGSDIRAFLAPGVPADLTRAALRRAWSADPAIRDFIGLSENAWEFTAPSGAPGFGSVTADDVQMLLARLTGGRKIPDHARPASERLSKERGPAVDGSAPGRASEVPESSADRAVPLHLADGDNIAMQHEFERKEYRAPRQRRGHGGALPE